MAKRESKNNHKGAAGHHRRLGEDFLARNKQKEGIIETASGLQHQIVEQTDGPRPDAYCTVRIHQRAQLLDGKLLEDTYRLNKPDEAVLNEMIDGLQEGLQLMSAGSRYKFWVPSELAWGKKGSSNKIPPFAVLAFDIRLVEIC
ncbi:FKBP-type peptidyl-prolyl cis-trans isomerase [Mangrovibacterium sp.]|uniref:FKBP-type peptidyl-prolyl cis-trans isomerase n=1 Tax=Mangrovibacterium sp. TaxID=1961364 RepID=UPI0035672078